jgi:hypothetical protein
MRDRGPEARMSWDGMLVTAFVSFAHFFVPFVEIRETLSG